MRLGRIVLIAVPLLALLAGGSQAQNPPPDCFGQKPTLVGGPGPDNMQGTSRSDVMVGEGLRAGAAHVTPWIAVSGFFAGVTTYYLHTAFTLAKRTRLLFAAMSVPVDDNDESGPVIRLTISVGVAALTGESQELTDMLAAADAALYHAKETGRNKTHVISASAPTV